MDIGIATDIYIIVATATSFGWGVAWNRTNALNLAVKFGFYAMAVAGTCIAGVRFGYIVQIGGG